MEISLAEGLFYGAALVLLISALGVVLSKRPLYSALWLVAALLTTGGIYAMLEAHFLAVVQIMVYAGAIVVLMVFVLMLLNADHEKLGPEAFLLGTAAAVTGACLLLALVPLFREGVEIVQAVRAGAPGGEPEWAVGSVKHLGELIFGRYVFAFEAASLLIMTALVGALMLARRRTNTANTKERE